MSFWKRLISGMLVFCICLTVTSCRAKKKEFTRFGMDINQLNPLVMTATDNSTGETVFSRDPSNISAVTDLFQNMTLSESDEVTDKAGISFTVSTMYGDFTYGECIQDRLRLDGIEYTLDKDYTKNVQRLYGLLKSETEHTPDVSADTILSITPDMTYRQLLDRFGETPVPTAAVGEKKAYLYKYKGRPFYILFEKDIDPVNMTGEQLIEEIWNNFNLAKSLTTPPPLEGGRLSAYEQAFDAIIALQKEKDDGSLTEILLDTKKLVRLNDSERQELARYLQDKYSVTVSDGSQAEMLAAGDLTQPAEPDKLVLWIDRYSYIGDQKMDFTAAGRREGQEAVTKQMELTWRDDGWRV